MSYWLGIIGTWLIADGVASIWTYPEQSWKRDHSLRLLRTALGGIIIYIGWIIR